MNKTTTVTVNVHDTSTEFLLITSSTLFYILIFLILKNSLVDKKGMLSSKERIKDDALQITALFCTIFALLGALMTFTIDSYQYSHVVIPLTYFIMLSVIGYEMFVVFYDNTPLVTTIPQLPNQDVEVGVKEVVKSSAPGFWTSSTTSAKAKRPVNF